MSTPIAPISWEHMDDISPVIDEVLRGDLDAYRRIVRRYEADIYRCVTPLVNNRSSTEEIVQDVFVTAYRSLHRFDRSKPFWPWLMGVTRNVVRNELRRKHRESSLLTAYSVYLDDATSDSAREQQAEAIEALAKCREELSEAAAYALRLRYDEEVPVEQVAIELKRSEAATHQLLYRTRLALRDCVHRRLVIGDQ